MRNVFIIALATLLFAACEAPDRSKTISTDVTTNRVELIDFYGTHRCVTCEAIEENAAYTVDHYFPDMLNSGKLTFTKIDVDKEVNYDMAEKFEATSTALFINVIKDGKEKHIDLTAFAFEKGKDKEVFSQELKAMLEEHLASL